MNSKKIILPGCVAACVFAASTATAQMRGHSGSMGRMGMRGGFAPHSMGGMPMHRGPMMNSPSGFRHFGNRDFNRIDRFHRFKRFNDGRFARFNRFDRFNRFNDVVFVGVGAGVLGGVGVRATRTDTKEVTTTATTVPVMDTAVASRVAELQSWLASAGITMAPSMESYGHETAKRMGCG
jgi:hypothetical protein